VYSSLQHGNVNRVYSGTVGQSEERLQPANSPWQAGTLLPSRVGGDPEWPAGYQYRFY